MEKVFDNKLLTLNLTDSYLRDYSHIKIGGKVNYLFAPKEVSILSQIIISAKKTFGEFRVVSISEPLSVEMRRIGIEL